MDPDNQFQDPADIDEDENMQMDPNDQIIQSDDNSQMQAPPENEDQFESSNQQRSIDIKDESIINEDPNEETLNNDVYKDDDDFLPDDENPANDENENDTKVKALSEKEEETNGVLENISSNMVGLLLPQNNENENKSQNDDENAKENNETVDNGNQNNEENINQNEEPINNNENINQTEDPINNENINENEEPINNEIPNANENQNDAENLNNENPNGIETINEDENIKTDENPNEIETINENDQLNDDKKENENQENATNEKDNQNAGENPQLDNTNNNEDHPSEEGMEVRDNISSPQRYTRPRRPLTSNESLSKLPPLSTDPDIDAENLRLLNNFKKKGRLPDPMQRAQLFQYIQREKVNNVVAQKFGKAQEFQNILQKYQKAIIEQEVKERNQEKLDALQNNLETIEEDIKQTEKQTKNKIGDEKEKQKEHYYNIIQKQDEELNLFERKWNDPNYIQKYAKPSSVLLAMKTKERSMVITKMFDQAEHVHNKVKELEKIESKQAQELAENDMEKEKQKILAKQDSQIEAYKIHCNQQIELIKRNHEVEKKKKQEKIQKLKDEIQELKKNPITALPPMSAPCQEMMAQSIMTPRTMKRYTMYKSQSKKPVLTLNPLKNVRPTKRSRTKFYSSLT